MREYLLKRVLLMVPTLFLVTILVFLMMRLIPGDVVLQMLEGYAYADSVEALRRDLGLDKPMHIQYLEWMSHLLRGDLGHSLWTKESIVAEFARRFPVTLELALLTIIVSVTFGVGVGVLSAVRQESWLDYIGRVVAILALAMPYFWLAILVVVLPAIYFRWTPLWTYVPFTTDPLENLKIMIFPALVFGVSTSRADHARHAFVHAGGAAPGLHSHRLGERLTGAQGHLQTCHQERLDPGRKHPRPADPFLSRGIGDYRVHLPVARHWAFFLRGADSARLPSGAEHQYDRRHLHARLESHRRLQLRIPGSPHSVSLSALTPVG